MAVGRDSIGTGAQDALAAFRKHPGQFLLVVFLVICCGATKKLHMFPMPWIAGQSQCIEILPASALDYTNEYMSYPANQHPNAPYGVKVHTFQRREGNCTEKAQVFTYVTESFTFTTANLVFFGFTKAIFNFVTGACCDAFGRKWTLVLGWLLAAPMPFMVLYATNWWTVASSSIFLGMQQALVWSTTIFMMVDILGQKHSGAAIGLNETIGYTTIALVNILAGYLLDEDAPRGDIYYIVIGLTGTGLLLGGVLLRDTRGLARQEEAEMTKRTAQEVAAIRTCTMNWPSGRSSDVPLARASFVYTSFVNTSLASICVAGLMINFISGFTWGLFVKWMKEDYLGADGQPKWTALDKDTIALIVLCYGLPKGVLQWGCGFLGDRFGRKPFIVGGLAIVALGLLALLLAGELLSEPEVGFFTGATLLGVGTGLMYSNNLAAICDHSDASWRSTALGAYRFWRDMGYAIGALLTGLFADAAGVGASVIVTLVLTIMAAVCVAVLYKDVTPGEEFDGKATGELEDDNLATPEQEITDEPIEERL